MPTSPTGTVTFLFTDVEGSTRLWEEHPDAMRPALARHDVLMRAAIETNDGIVFKTMGDAFYAAFHTAPDALNATLAAQLALHTEPWPAPVTLKVRMALHTGAAEVRDNDYFGQPLNRVARLLAAGHGEQALVSMVTQELVRDGLPPACSLLSLGDHRLKDLNRPETVFQLLHPGLPSEFPPLRSLDNPELPNNLPVQLTSFIGREQAMQDVKTLLEKTHLLTLTGSGGCGKTRLSLQAAAEVLEQFPDGAWLVELASLTDPALVPQAVASILGVKEQPGQTIQQSLTDRLKSKRLLLVLDNCEHLLSSCAQLTATLLRSCPQVKVFASSREALGIAGEQTYRVPSLSSPDPKQTPTAQSLSQYEAIRLFIERAQFHKPDFVVTNQNAPALASVCHRLDGIPLAIELAAARVKVLSVEDINSRLDDRFHLLTGGDRTALPRQQTLRAAIDWSYDLLNVQEKLLLARLSAFAGGWTLSAAEQVCLGESTTEEGIENWEALDLLTSLVDKSLVIAEEQEGSVRYRLLETIREYATEKLTQEERKTLPRRHAEFFLRIAEQAETGLRGAEQTVWLGRLEAEHDNLRAALEWTRENDTEAGLRLATTALPQFWEVHGHWREGYERLTTMLHRYGDSMSPLRAKALLAAGNLVKLQGDYTAAVSLLEESRQLHEALGIKPGLASALNNLALVAQDQGNDVEARSLHEEGLEIKRELGDPLGIAYSLSNLGYMAYLEGDDVPARSYLEEAIALLRSLGEKRLLSNALNNLGGVLREQGEPSAARAHLMESLALRQETGDRRGLAYSLGEFARLAAAQGQPDRAARFLGAGEALREEIGFLLSPAERAREGRFVASLRATLGEEAMSVAWQRGRTMPREQAFADALGKGEQSGSI